MSSREKHQSVLTAVLEWCRKRRGTKSALPPAAPGVPGAPETATRLYDGSLLYRCMDMLRINRDEIAKDDPLLFRELQGRCALCRDKEECVHAQAREFDDASWDRWREYCPNSSTLTTIGAVQNCALAAQYFKMPRSTTAAD